MLHYRAFHNTLEDFAWDQNKQYMVIVSYTRFLYLCDYNTLDTLYEGADQEDDTKGLCFLNSNQNLEYKADFITYGRLGEPLYHRIHDERIIGCGYLDKNPVY